MDLDFLTAFGLDSDALLRSISSHIDDEMLREIAEADYKQDVDEFLACLRPIRDGLAAPPLQFVPTEVLYLISLSEPADPDWKPGSTGVRGHWMRAFCCTALLRSYDGTDHGYGWIGMNCKLVALALSLDEIDCDLRAEAAALLSQFIVRFEDLREDDELAFAGVALLYFGLCSKKFAGDATIIELCDWIFARELVARSQIDWKTLPDDWLLPTSYQTSRCKDWIKLGRRMLAIDITTRSQAARDRITRIASSLAAQTAPAD